MSNLSIWGITPKTFNEAVRLCELISESDFVPRAKQGKPMDILLSIQYAHEVGLTPMCGLQNIHPINGVPSIAAKTLLGLAKRQPDYVSCEETIEGTGEDMKAICKLQRKNEVLHISTFSVQDAKTAKLWGKKGKFGDSAWITFPQRMLKARARSNAVCDVFPDVLCGLISTEEAQDYPETSKPPMQDITPKPNVTNIFEASHTKEPVANPVENLPQEMSETEINQSKSIQEKEYEENKEEIIAKEEAQQAEKIEKHVDWEDFKAKANGISNKVPVDNIKREKISPAHYHDLKMKVGENPRGWQEYLSGAHKKYNLTMDEVYELKAIAEKALVDLIDKEQVGGAVNHENI